MRSFISACHTPSGVEQAFSAVYLILTVGNINLRLLIGQYLLHNKGKCSCSPSTSFNCSWKLNMSIIYNFQIRSFKCSHILKMTYSELHKTAKEKGILITNEMLVSTESIYNLPAVVHSSNSSTPL